MQTGLYDTDNEKAKSGRCSGYIPYVGTLRFVFVHAGVDYTPAQLGLHPACSPGTPATRVAAAVKLLRV